MTSPNPLFPRLSLRMAEKVAVPSSPPVLLAHLGDSFTQGYFEKGVLDAPASWPHQLWLDLSARHPAVTFASMNFGVGGESIVGGRARLGQILPHRPDLITVGFGLNDAIQGMDGLAAFKENFEFVLKTFMDAGFCEVLPLTPTPMVSRENNRVHPEHRAMGLVEKFIALVNGGVVAAYTDAIREVAMGLKLPLGDLTALWQSWQAQGVDPTDRLSNGLNHPDRPSHKAMAAYLGQLLSGGASVKEGPSGMLPLA